MRNFRQLNVWQEAHRLTLSVYRLTSTFPREETYGLASQLRKSCSSIPANIAEGCGRETVPDFRRFLGIAAASATETEYHLLLSRDLTYLKDEEYQPADESIQRIKRMLVGLSRKLRSDSSVSGQSPTANDQQP